MKVFTSKKGVALIVAFSVIVVVSIYLSSYVMWAIWDQRNLVRQQGAEEAEKIARAGLNRAILDLYQDSDSWLDGEINGVVVTPPNGNSPNAFYTLYSETLENGSYTVQIDYLQNPKTCTTGCSFLDKQIWVRSTGTSAGTSRVLEQIVNYYSIKNFTQNMLYANLQYALNAANNNDNIGISAVILNENVSINAARRFNIRGGYDPNFTDINRRSCSSYPTIINGNLTISGNADVELSGVTIQ